MTCSTRWSTLSAVGDDKSTDVACLSDEVMTGCSSRTEVHVGLIYFSIQKSISCIITYFISIDTLVRFVFFFFLNIMSNL